MAKCLNCRHLFEKRPQNSNQQYCSKSSCQKARKCHWQRQKMASDPEYRKNQKESQDHWKKNHPDYLKLYRENNPHQVQRNRELQKIRNARRDGKTVSPVLQSVSLSTTEDSLASKITVLSPIAKMDASSPYQLCLALVSSPSLIAKMDASKLSDSPISKAFIQLPLIAKMDV